MDDIPDAADRPTASPGRVPAPFTTFVGRSGELEQIKRLMGQSRLVTLSGVGGVGKTRLATRAVGDLAVAFPDGVWFIELAALRDPALLPHTMVDAMGISQRSARYPMTALIEYLRPRNALLVLDNCEHLLDSVAKMVDQLLHAADRLRILTTSRQRIGVTGETLLTISPLGVPEAGASLTATRADAFPAVRLFSDRASTVIPGFRIDSENVEAVSRLCQRLEGIPLALELAAVRLRILPVNDLAARLEDRFSVLTEGSRGAHQRHRTLRATVDWSYDLCTPQEQLLWSRVAIFAGSFDLDAVQAICADDALPAEQMLDTLAGLVDKSIVIAEQAGGHARFRVLETIREYGASQLRRAGAEHAFKVRHRDWYLRLIERACSEWFGPNQEQWCLRLRLDQPNLRAGLEFSVSAPKEAQVALTLVGRPWFLWVCLYLAEGRHWLDQALAATAEPSVERLRALTTAGYVASLQGDRTGAQEVLQQYRETRPGFDDPQTAAYFEHVQGVYLLFFGTAHACAQRLTCALGLYESLPVPEDLRVVAQIQLGLSLIFSGDVAEAAARLERCRKQCEAIGEEWLLSYALYGLALADYAGGSLTSAIENVELSLRTKRVFGDTLGLAMTLDLAAWIKAEQGAAKQAATLLGSAAHLWRTFGVELFGSSHWLAHRHRCETKARAALGAAFDLAYASGTGLTIDEAIGQVVVDDRDGAAPPDRILSPRELQVADLVARGLANKAIAAQLHVSQRTAETHIQHILTKLGFTCRAQIANWIGEGHAEGSRP